MTPRTRRTGVFLWLAGLATSTFYRFITQRRRNRLTSAHLTRNTQWLLIALYLKRREEDGGRGTAEHYVYLYIHNGPGFDSTPPFYYVLRHHHVVILEGKAIHGTKGEYSIAFSSLPHCIVGPNLRGLVAVTRPFLRSVAARVSFLHILVYFIDFFCLHLKQFVFMQLAIPIYQLILHAWRDCEGERESLKESFSIAVSEKKRVDQQDIQAVGL